MSRSSRAAELRERRRELRERLRRRRPEKRRRRRWVWVLSLVLVLLAAVWCCGCPPEPPPIPDEPAVEAGGGEVEALPAPVAPPLARIERRDRPTYENEGPEPLGWIDAFRLQVAARSPRLAECFVGAERPGALKWTASVEPGSGRVSDHVIEPVLGGPPLTREQRECVLGVLTEPGYRLEGGERSTPSRVSMAIEF